MKRQVGQTKDVGFQFGIQKTFPLSLEKTWNFMFSGKGLSIWLGELENGLENKKTFYTKDGIEGFVRVFKYHSHIRMNWKMKGWENMSTVQVRVIKNKEKSKISFHQEKLINAEQRAEMKEFWSTKMNEITEELDKVI